MQRAQNSQNSYEKKNNVRGLTLLDLKVYYKAKVVVYGIGVKVNKNTATEQSVDMDLCIYDQLNF